MMIYPPRPRWLDRLVHLGVILSLSVTATTDASPIRVTTLGGESRLLVDETNLFIYPALAGTVPHTAVELFDDWAGIAFPLNKRHTAGLFLGRPTAALTRFNGYLGQSGSDLFRSLEARPWIDLFYAASLTPRLRAGLSARVAVDREEALGGEAAASEIDLRFGLGLGRVDHSQIDATFGLRRLELEDRPSAGPALEETDGDGYVVDVRARIPKGKNLLLIPYAAVENSSYALMPDTRDELLTSFGVGINARPAPSVLAIAGLVFEHSKISTAEPGLPETEETLTTGPAVIIGSEAQVGSLLFRLGVRHESNFVEVKRGPNQTTKSFDTAIAIDLGIGLEFGPLMLDGYLERDFLRDGPHLIGGSRHGGGIFSKLSLTYRL
jgi:hypothetical protein